MRRMGRRRRGGVGVRSGIVMGRVVGGRGGCLLVYCLMGEVRV
jgi:hypothetical protein